VCILLPHIGYQGQLTQNRKHLQMAVMVDKDQTPTFKSAMPFCAAVDERKYFQITLSKLLSLVKGCAVFEELSLYSIPVTGGEVNFKHGLDGTWSVSLRGMEVSEKMLDSGLQQQICQYRWVCIHLWEE